MSEKWVRSTRTIKKWVPKISSYSRPFWEATKRRELVIQECANCGGKIYPPAPVCPFCFSDNLRWVKSSGRGKVLTFTTIYEYSPSWVRDFLPYILALVKLEEGVVMLSHIVGCKPEEVKCDMDVEVTFENITEDFVVPKFKPVK
ncbi:MAG: Zn-ribbon domain-containing OB-fold protein [Candidatus Bathyarchaeia archaeon]